MATSEVPFLAELLAGARGVPREDVLVSGEAVESDRQLAEAVARSNEVQEKAYFQTFEHDLAVYEAAALFLLFR